MRKSLLVVLVAPLMVGCGSKRPNILSGVQSIAYLQRAPISDPGNVFDYSAGAGKANIFTLTPPAPDGKKVNVTNWTGGDIMSMDVSFDGREIAFSGKASGDSNFHIYRINVDSTNPCDAALGKVSQGACQITMGPYDDTYPIYAAGGQIVFTTNENVEGDEVPQFEDEYERARTAQLAFMNIDGSARTLGARNVSHRVSPCLLSDGRVMFTQWDHLGEKNNGDLMVINQDSTVAREAFGKENDSAFNSHLRCHEVTPGNVVVIGTSRDRTYQAGKLVLVHLGGPTVDKQSEATATYSDLTPDVPGDNTPSFMGVGRYYDAVPIGTNGTQYLTSWSDGAVQTSLNTMAQSPPQFGIYVYDSASQTRFPLVNDIGYWDTTPRVIAQRPEPPATAATQLAQGTSSTLMAAINVYDSTMFPSLPPGTVKMVRVTEGFSAEEGFPDDFGLTEFDGQSRLGETPLQADGSFKVLVPPNVPVRFQLIDQFGMAATAAGGSPGGDTVSEPIWIQGRPGEARVCGGCHENRLESIQIAPGSSTLQAQTAQPFDYPGVPRQQRASTTYTKDAVRGIPWPDAIQPIFDAHCIGCHDGSKGAANPSYTLMDVTDMTTFSWTFDLTGRMVNLDFGSNMYTYSASHITMLGPSMALTEKQVVVTAGEIQVYVSPGSAHDSTVIQMLNPMQQYPTVDPTVRLNPNKPIHPAEVGSYTSASGTFNGADPAYQLDYNEYFLLQMMADNGGQYFARENRPYMTGGTN